MASRKKRGIYKRGTRYWIDFTTIHGERIRESAGFSLAAAERLLAQRRVEAEEIDLDPRGRRVTLRKYAATYLERARGRKKSWERDEQLIAHLNAHLGDRFLIDITPQVIEGYQAARLEEESKRQRKKPKPATVNREVACLERIMAATGHKTMHIFQRYSHVDEHELELLKGPAAVPQKAGGSKGEP